MCVWRGLCNNWLPVAVKGPDEWVESDEVFLGIVIKFTQS